MPCTKHPLKNNPLTAVHFHDSELYYKINMVSTASGHAKNPLFPFLKPCISALIKNPIKRIPGNFFYHYYHGNRHRYSCGKKKFHRLRAQP